MNNTIKSILIILVGITSIVLSICCFSLSTGSVVQNITYGGDAYTGMQNASAQAATNIVELASITKIGFGSILLVVGMLLVIIGISIPLSDSKGNKLINSDESNQINSNSMKVVNEQNKEKMIDRNESGDVSINP